MKHLKEISLTFIALAVVFLIIIGIVLFHVVRKLDSITNVETGSIRVQNNSDTFYFKTKVWGIAGNHEQIILSESEDGVPDHNVDYFFYTPELFYAVKDSHIYVFAPEYSISEPIENNLDVIIKGLKTQDEIRDYNANYSSYGLERVSVYNH